MIRKYCLLGVAVALLGTALRGQVVPIAATVSGSGSFNNSAALLVDGVTPPEGTNWQNTTNVYWTGTDPAFTLDFGASYLLTGINWSVDNNDSYALAYSLDGVSFTALFTVAISDGNVDVNNPGGMDTMSSFSSDPEFVASMSFAPVDARYLRLQAVGGDGSFAVAEVTPYTAAIPEPSTYAAILGTGVLVVVFGRRHLRR